jgi:probable phosphoglycerate mutase
LARDKDIVARRESNKWGFLPPGGESYAQLTLRLRAWHETIDTDTVVAAHGGTARALIAHLEIATPENATHYSIEHGVVYVFASNHIERYD